MTRGRIVTTVDYAASTGWRDAALVLDCDEWISVDLVRRVLRETREAGVAVLDGSSGFHRDLVIAALLRIVRRHLAVVVVDATWRTGAGWRQRLRRWAFKSFDSPRVTYGVLSAAECSTFPRTWRIPAARVFNLPWYVRIPQGENATETEERMVFAGGDSLRDFETLLAAADGGTFSLRIGSRTLPPGLADTMPNVSVESLPPSDFIATFRRAHVIVVPLEARTDRSAGQQTYLRAMAIGVPVVVTDALGVSQYIQHDRTGWLVPPGDAQALRKRLEWILDPANAAEVKAVTAAAASDVERFSPEACVDILLGWIERIDSSRSGA